MKENLKYWKQIRNLKKFCTFISYFVCLWTFIAMSFRGTSMFGWGVPKHEIGTVLHSQPPDVQIFGTDPSLATTLIFGNI